MWRNHGTLYFLSTRNEYGYYLWNNSSVILEQREFRRLLGFSFPGRTIPTIRGLLHIGRSWMNCSLKVTVCCGVEYIHFVQNHQFFFENNDERYSGMINECLMPQLNILGLKNVWFLHDGVTAHTACDIMRILWPASPGFWYHVLPIFIGRPDQEI